MVATEGGAFLLMGMFIKKKNCHKSKLFRAWCSLYFTLWHCSAPFVWPFLLHVYDGFARFIIIIPFGVVWTYDRTLFMVLIVHASVFRPLVLLFGTVWYIRLLLPFRLWGAGPFSPRKLKRKRLRAWTIILGISEERGWRGLGTNTTYSIGGFCEGLRAFCFCAAAGMACLYTCMDAWLPACCGK